MTTSSIFLDSCILDIEGKISKHYETLKNAQHNLDIFNWLSTVEYKAYIGGNRQTLLVTPALYEKPVSGNTYGTHPTLHYYRKQHLNRGSEPITDQCLIVGRKIASIHAFKNVDIIDDADILIHAHHKDNEKISYTNNKDCRLYLDKFDFSQMWISKTVDFMSKLNINNPDSMPEWLESYILLK